MNVERSMMNGRLDGHVVGHVDMKARCGHARRRWLHLFTFHYDADKELAAAALHGGQEASP